MLRLLDWCIDNALRFGCSRFLGWFSRGLTAGDVAEASHGALENHVRHDIAHQIAHHRFIRQALCRFSDPLFATGNLSLRVFQIAVRLLNLDILFFRNLIRNKDCFNRCVRSLTSSR